VADEGGHYLRAAARVTQSDVLCSCDFGFSIFLSVSLEEPDCFVDSFLIVFKSPEMGLFPN